MQIGKNTDDIKKISGFSGPQKFSISAEGKESIFLKKAIKVGNSAGVLLPRSFLGCEVEVRILHTPINIKKDVLKILENYLEEILGIYLTNKTEKEIEILVISSGIKKIIQYEKYKINIVPLVLIKKDLKNEPRLKVKLNQAKVILNKALLFELRKDL